VSSSVAERLKPRLAVALALDPVLTPDLLAPRHFDRLARFAKLLSRTPLTEFRSREALAVLAKTEVLLTGWGCPALDAAAVEAAPGLRVLAHTGSTVKPIVSDAAWERGISVTSAAAANGRPVAEFALAAILLANKGVFTARERYRQERRAWRYPWTAPGEPGNFGATVGVVGASRIGRQLLDLLRPFDLNVLLYDPVALPDVFDPSRVERVDLERLLRRSDVVSLHAPLLPETTGMIDAARLSLLRDGAVLINTARGELVDRAALSRELRSRRISALLDVTDPEPLPADSELFSLPNVFVTPHIAGAAGRETERLADLALDEIERFAAGQPLLHRVTREMLDLIG
jgi:phosphoglycerate dehydrogenase-like enzyme